MTTYGIDTGGGDAVTTGLPEQTARRTAQRLANERGESLYLYALAEGDGEPGESEEISPEWSEAITVQASNPRPSQYTEPASEDMPDGVLVGAVDVDVVVTIGVLPPDRTITVAQVALDIAAGRLSPDTTVWALIHDEADSAHVESMVASDVQHPGIYVVGLTEADAHAAVERERRTVSGEVTLARNEADGVTLESWGSPDMWVSGGLLAAIRAASEDSDARRDMLSTLAAEAAAVGQQVAAP